MYIFHNIQYIYTVNTVHAVYMRNTKLLETLTTRCLYGVHARCRVGPISLCALRENETRNWRPIILDDTIRHGPTNDHFCLCTEAADFRPFRHQLCVCVADYITDLGFLPFFSFAFAPIIILYMFSLSPYIYYILDYRSSFLYIGYIQYSGRALAIYSLLYSGIGLYTSTI